jgi:hypothetical protein
MADEHVQTSTETENLPVPLKDADVHAKMAELSRHCQRLENLLEERREVTGRYNTDIKQIRGVIKELAATTTTGKQTQPVQVRVVKDFAAGTITKTRLDTKEVFVERSMTEEEAQMELAPEDGEEPKLKRGRPKKRGAEAPVADGEFPEVGDEPPPNMA